MCGRRQAFRGGRAALRGSSHPKGPARRAPQEAAAPPLGAHPEALLAGSSGPPSGRAEGNWGLQSRGELAQPVSFC